jgi:predicted TIM-barrel fold metal-dependent hydrolase
MDADREWIVSVDDHAIEPAGVWYERLSKADRADGPRHVVIDGVAQWQYDGKIIPIRGLWAAAGKSVEEFSPSPISYEEMRPGCYDSVARLEDMNIDGVLASLCFPSFPRFCGQTFYEGKNRELALKCVRAYNDWMLDEWCGSAPGRYIPMIILPLWDPVEGAREIVRNVDKGAKAIAFSENPAKLGLPSIHSAERYWDPVFAAADETGLAICTHIGSSSSMPNTSADAPTVLTTATQAVNLMLCTADWIFSGVFSRFENLNLCLSEGGIGWIPYLLERMDQVVARQKHWASKSPVTRSDVLAGKGDTDMPSNWDYSEAPSSIFRKHIYGCFIDEEFGVRCIDDIGVDNVMIETDYPHTDSSWPHSQVIAMQRLKDRSPEDRFKILRGNACRVFNFVPADPTSISLE